MAKENNIDWKPILICGGTGLVCLAFGVFVAAPMWQKHKAKEAQKKLKTPARK